MDRRLILLGLAAGAATPALLPALPAWAAMGEAEKDYVTKTAAAGGASLQMADIGLQKASNAKVKQFAKFEHDEQTTIAEILKAMSPGLATPKPDAKTADMIEKLKGAGAGAEFDRMFVRGQIDGHQQLLAIQETYLKGGKDVPTMAVAKLARGQIKEHLALLEDLSKMS